MKICVIGAVNMDIGGFSKNKALLGDSNIGSIRFSPGGVGRNICENLARLGADTLLITAFGDDFYAEKLKDDCRALGIDISHSLCVGNAGTSSYLFIADDTGDMICAINDMDIYSRMDRAFLSSELSVINACDLCVLDANLQEQALVYLLKNVTVPVFLDPVSVDKGKKVLPCLDKITGFKPNLLEAMELTGACDYRQAGKALLDKGVQNVFISLAGKGLYYADKETEGLVQALDVEVKNTTGAGDSLLAALAFAHGLGYSIRESARFGVSASQICIGSEDTVSKEISFDRVKQMEKEVGNG